MKAVASNCGCCAIKHVRDFPDSPEHPCHISIDGHDEDQISSSPEPYSSWLEEDDDLQLSNNMRGGEAFRAIVAQIKRRRPAGLITLNLTADSDSDYCCEECNGCSRSEYDANNSGYDESQIRAWSPILEELGFTCQTVLNSNSGNRIHHYTLVYDEGGWEA